MKNLIALFLFVLISISALAHSSDSLLLKSSEGMNPFYNSQADQANAYILKNNLKVNVIHFLMAGINVAYERRLTNFLTVQVEGNYFFYYNYEPMQVANVNVQFRLYPLARKFYAPKGLYFGLLVGYGFAYGYYDNTSYYDALPNYVANRNAKDYTATYHSNEIGMRIGYQFVWRTGLTLDLGTGWSLFPLAKNYPGNTPSFNRYLIPAFTTALGFNF